MRFRLLWLGLMLVSNAQAQLKPEDVHQFTLQNGMKFFVLEDHSIPNANLYTFWKVGSRNEAPGTTGLSHFFEHMMFNGAKKYGPKEFDRVMERNGGANNAYTSQDQTVYTDWFPSSALETIFDLEADRIRDLAIADQMVESERGVVLSERSTNLENSNFTLLYENLISVAFSEHPYSWPVIGYESDIKNWSKQDLVNYFKTYYAPNNALVVIVGDVRVDQVKKLAAQYFEPIPVLAPAPREIHTVEPEQQGERRLMVKKDVSTPNIMLAYHVPAAKSPDFYALDLLSSILSRGNSSRLYSSLVDKQELATYVTTDYSMTFDPGLFIFYGVCADSVSAEKLEAAMYVELDKLLKNGLTETELQKVKNQKLMDFYHQIETINGMANNIGTYERYFGDYRKLYDAPAEYAKVSAADVLRVAKTYLKKSNRTVGYLQPNVD